MSPNLRDLLHELADHETAAATAAAPDTRTEVRHVMTDIRSSRTRRVAVVGAAAATVLAIGVATATALTPAPRVPAVLDPAPTVTASPTPSTTATPTAEPAPTPAPATLTGLGLVDSLATAPRALWELSPRSVLGLEASQDVPTFVDVRTGAPYGAFSAVEAGDVLVTQVSGSDGGYVLAGLDATTGATVWARDDEPLPSWPTCAAALSNGLLACLAIDASASGRVVTLLDPTDGTLVRTIPLGFDPLSVGAAGGTVIVHGHEDEATPRWDALDTATGATVWSHLDPGGATDEEPPGDVFASTSVEGDIAFLAGYTYHALIDVRTGERTTAGASLTGIRELPTLWVPADGVTVPAFERVGDTSSDAAVIRALDPVSGDVLWTSREGVYPLVDVVGDGVFVYDQETTYYLDLATGRERWSTTAGWPVATDGERVLLGPTRASGLSVVSVSDGSEVWSWDEGTDVWFAPGLLAVSREEGVRMFGW